MLDLYTPQHSTLKLKIYIKNKNKIKMKQNKTNNQINHAI